MFKINIESKKIVTQELAELRVTDKKTALLVRKLFSALLKKEFEAVPTDSKELTAAYTGSVLTTLEVIKASILLLDMISFEEIVAEEIEEVEIEEIEVGCNQGRYHFIDNLDIHQMDANQLCLVLFRDMGTDIETEVIALTAGLKDKTDALHRVKRKLFLNNPTIRPEVIIDRLANALAVTKLEMGSCLATRGTKLAVQANLKTTTVTDHKNFVFLANAEPNKTLELMVLKAAFKQYKELVAQGTLQVDNKTNWALIMAITSTLNGLVDDDDDEDDFRM